MVNDKNIFSNYQGIQTLHILGFHLITEICDIFEGYG